MILCCGEALIDMLPRKCSGGDECLMPVTGGSVFNTAIALGRLGAPAGFLCGVSTDKFGRMLIADMDESGVDHSLCIRTNRLTTLACIDLDGAEAIYTFYDEASAGRMVNHDAVPNIPAAVNTLLFGGISLIHEPCGNAYEAVLTSNAATKVTYLDPNIRAGFIKDHEAHRARIRRMIALSDIVKVSNDDLAWIEPNRSRDSAIRSWLNSGTKIVLLSKGCDGAESHTVQGTISVAAVPVDVIDTVGAGDTFNAGFLASLARENILNKTAISNLDRSVIELALNFAAKTASIAASRAGANPPWNYEL